jgi:hypothetical protein
MGGPASDHDPIVLKLEFKQKRRGIVQPKLSKTGITWDKLNDQETAAEFQEVAMANLRELTSKGIPMAKAFSKTIVKAAEQTYTEDAPINKGWFATARTILEPYGQGQQMAKGSSIGSKQRDLQSVQSTP